MRGPLNLTGSTTAWHFGILTGRLGDRHLIKIYLPVYCVAPLCTLVTKAHSATFWLLVTAALSVKATLMNLLTEAARTTAGGTPQRSD